MLAHYRGASLFVLASVITADGDRDGLPNVLMEAQSQRVCCIASNISAIPEIVTDGDTGCLVPANDASVLAAAIERLGTDPALRRRMAARAVERLHERFSAGHEIGRVHALLNAP
ncbi:MAG: glycosyltransferase [Gammaproteobacteria bacterium]|nr:glycosyltransferase [Gammaproteobacteria bacterium]